MLQTSIDLEKMIDNYNIIDNIMVLPGNHDSSTVCSWYNNLDYKDKEKLKTFLQNNNCLDSNINYGLIQYCFKSKSRIIMVTVQDILELDDDSRINIPGVTNSKNWTWKLKDFSDFRKNIIKYRELS